MYKPDNIHLIGFTEHCDNCPNMNIDVEKTFYYDDVQYWEVKCVNLAQCNSIYTYLLKTSKGDTHE